MAEARGRYGQVFVAYADCGTGGLLAARCAALGVEMIAGPHCYSFFDGNDTFAARGDGEMLAFYLTDFLVRQFDAFVWRPMGLDRHPELRDMIFGNYRSLVYLAQTDDPALDAEAARCAARLGLAYERRLTGYGDLAPALAALGPPLTSGTAPCRCAAGSGCAGRSRCRSRPRTRRGSRTRPTSPSRPPRAATACRAARRPRAASGCGS